MSEDYSKHYIQNDALCPRPVSGPRVMVGFWIGPECPESKPELSGGPLFTITYPVGGGDTCYNWKHITDDPEDLIHPNSAQNIEWLKGQMQFEQSTEFGCRPKLTRMTEPTLKTAHWELFQDFPLELWGRILATYEINQITVREKSKLRFCAADGHYIGLTSQDDVTCEKRLLDESCYFTARFPNYVWDAHGGKGDLDGSFYLQAANGCFLRLVDSNGNKTLRAEAANMTDAELFTATIIDGSLISLATKDNLTLQHDPPYGELHLLTEGDPTWAWFNASYA